MEEVKMLDGSTLKKMLVTASNYLETRVDEINALNVYPVPDGDTGTNMNLTLKSAVEGIMHEDTDHAEKLADVAAENALMGARGNSGVILAQILRGLARGLKGKKIAYPLDVAKAFQYGVVLAYRAVSRPVEGTILTVAREMAKGAKNASRENDSFIKLLEEAVFSGYQAVKRTQNQLPALAEAGVVDAGGLGLLVVIEGCLKGISEKRDITTFSSENRNRKKFFNGKDELIHPYCTELIVKGRNIRSHRLQQELEELGESLFVVDGKGFTKVHIHTNHPGEVLELCMKRGTLHSIKIDNMLDQHRDSLKTGEEKDVSRVNMVAVCNGPGLERIFKDLGAAEVLLGGPTMNPRVRDFVEAIRKIEGQVIILPNDKNIKLAAEQATQLVNKRVEVLPAEDIPQGMAAATAFNPEAGMEENLEKMKKRMAEIISGGVTYATRDAVSNGLTLCKGDVIGLKHGKLVAIGKEREKVLLELLSLMVTEESELATILYGKDVKEEEIKALQKKLHESYSDLEIEVIEGGQSLYYYLVSVE